MPPLALLAALAALAVIAGSRSSSSGASTGYAFGKGRPEGISAPNLRILLPPKQGLQSLTAAEKVRLFADMQQRYVVEHGRSGDSEAMAFASPNEIQGKKAAPATDVLYGANMGLGLPNKLAILVSKDPSGKTLILADGKDWQKKTQPGSRWNIFLQPGEASLVARASRVSVRGAAAAPSAMSRLQKGGGLADPGRPMVLQRPIESGSEAGPLLSPVAGFISDDAEKRATTSADELSDPLAIIRDNYVKAHDLYMKNDTEGARGFSAILAPAVRPLRDAGYALASAQLQTLLAKIGTPIDALLLGA